MLKLENYKSGTFVTNDGYKSFNPSLINIQYSWDDLELTNLVEKAAIAIGQLDAYSHLVPNVNHFIKMYVAKEAIVSSRIEGTQTNMEEALLNEKDVNPERKNDWQEVTNYIKAMNNAILELPSLPISSRLIKKSHETLLSGARGEDKLPGEFRRSQNWIGGSTLNNAVYVPTQWQNVNQLMGDLENFLHSDKTGLTHLIKIAIAHYQFETIHPFLDGNGRIGRLLITLYLVEKEMLKKPVLYLSDFFEKNKSFYYDNLTRVRTHNDIINWIKFFLRGVVETSENSTKALKDILELKKECEENRIYKLGKKVAKAKVLLDYLYQQPILDAEEVASATNLSAVSSYNLINDFVNHGILKESTGFKRNRIFIFDEYFSIFKR